MRDDQVAMDQLKQNGIDPISYEQGMAKAKEIKAVTYLECSALNHNGLNDVFEEVVRVYIKNQKPKKKTINCSIF